MGDQAAGPASGSVEAAVREAIEEYEAETGDLAGVQRAFAAVAYVLARDLDKGAGMGTAAVARELRQALQALTEAGDDDDAAAALAARLSTPVGDTPPT